MEGRIPRNENVITNYCSAARETISLLFGHYLGWHFSISCSKDLGIKAERNVGCHVRWCFLFSCFSMWHPQAWAKCLNSDIYGLCQDLQVGSIGVYSSGWATYDMHFEMWSTSLALWWDYMAFIWDGDISSKEIKTFSLIHTRVPLGSQC